MRFTAVLFALCISAVAEVTPPAPQPNPVPDSIDKAWFQAYAAGLKEQIKMHDASDQAKDFCEKQGRQLYTDGVTGHWCVVPPAKTVNNTPNPKEKK